MTLVCTESSILLQTFRVNSKINFKSMKKIFSFLVLAIVAIAAFSATKIAKTSNNIDLASIAQLNPADAACLESSLPALNTGRCGSSGNCFAMSGSDCDPWKSGSR